MSGKARAMFFPDKALVDIDAVIHLAGEPVADGRWTEERKKKIYDSRVLGTRKVIEAIARNSKASKQIHTFVCGSAVGFYGSREDEVLNETIDSWRRLPCSSRYRLGKGSGFIFPRLTRAVSFTFGPGSSSRDTAERWRNFSRLFQKGLGGRLADGKQWMSWIHFEDICRLFRVRSRESRSDGRD